MFPVFLAYSKFTQAQTYTMYGTETAETQIVRRGSQNAGSLHVVPLMNLDLLLASRISGLPMSPVFTCGPLHVPRAVHSLGAVWQRAKSLPVEG